MWRWKRMGAPSRRFKNGTNPGCNSNGIGKAAVAAGKRFGATHGGKQHKWIKQGDAAEIARSFVDLGLTRPGINQTDVESNRN